MFKKLFNTVKLNAQIKVKDEALKTVNADIDMLMELLEHPLKKQKTIKALLGDMKTAIENATK